MRLPDWPVEIRGDRFVGAKRDYFLVRDFVAIRGRRSSAGLCLWPDVGGAGRKWHDCGVGRTGCGGGVSRKHLKTLRFLRKTSDFSVIPVRSSESLRPEKPAMAFQTADFSSSSGGGKKPRRRAQTLPLPGRFSRGELRNPGGAVCRGGADSGE